MWSVTNGCFRGSEARRQLPSTSLLAVPDRSAWRITDSSAAVAANEVNVRFDAQETADLMLKAPPHSLCK